MKDYYLSGEERFGPMSSLLYLVFVKLWGRAFYEFVVDDLDETTGGRLLDVGTGPGDVPIALAKKQKFSKIYSVDPSKQMVSLAEYRAGGDKKLVFELGASRHIPFDKKFDIIYSALSYHHWKAKQYSLRYMSHFLKDGGEIRIYEYDKERLAAAHRFLAPTHAIAIAKLERDADSAGLKVKDVKRKGMLIRATLVKR